MFNLNMICGNSPDESGIFDNECMEVQPAHVALAGLLIFGLFIFTGLYVILRCPLYRHHTFKGPGKPQKIPAQSSAVHTPTLIGNTRAKKYSQHPKQHRNNRSLKRL